MKLNLTARAARWSAAHWKTATFAWLAFVAAAVVLGGMAGSKNLTDSENATGETARAESILAHAGFAGPAGESVLIQSRRQTVTSRGFVRIVREPRRLVVEVADDGHGGADPAGSGLTGLRRRVQALDGKLTLVSPSGAGTTLRAELPCAS